MRLSVANLVFLDVETTGLSPDMGDRVIEVGLWLGAHAAMPPKR